MEVLIALVITAFGILGFAGLLKVIGDMEAEDTWATKALFCAQERVEELTFDSATGNDSEGEGEEACEEGPYQGLRRHWAVRPSDVFDGLLEIKAECEYPWKGSRKGVELTTIVFPEG